MNNVKQLHRLMPEQVEKLLNYMAQEFKGEDTFSLLAKEDQMDLISMLCDNPTEWWAKYEKHLANTFRLKDGSYWTGNGKYQDFSDKVEKLVPARDAVMKYLPYSLEPKQSFKPLLECFRVYSNIYYDFITICTTMAVRICMIEEKSGTSTMTSTGAMSGDKLIWKKWLIPSTSI